VDAPQERRPDDLYTASGGHEDVRREGTEPVPEHGYVPAKGAATVIASKYILLTTYRATGEAVATPVWFAEDGERLLVWTGAKTGKVRRIRANGHVTICPCTATGRPTGEAFQATARILPAEQGPAVQRLLDARYGVVKRVIDLYNEAARRIRRRTRVEPAYLAITMEP
jgi:PPOX class probable F420-dependent enzyme